MTKTGLEFEQEFFGKVKGQLAITGQYYRDGMRPSENVATSEDCLVIFKTGLDGDIQRGYITINVYVPDILFNGKKVKDIGRCSTIESKLNTFVNSLKMDGYMLEREGTIKTFQVFETDEHFVHLELKYNYSTL